MSRNMSQRLRRFCLAPESHLAIIQGCARADFRELPADATVEWIYHDERNRRVEYIVDSEEFDEIAPLSEIPPFGNDKPLLLQAIPFNEMEQRVIRADPGNFVWREKLEFRSLREQRDQLIERLQKAEMKLARLEHGEQKP